MYVTIWNYQERDGGYLSSFINERVLVTRNIISNLQSLSLFNIFSIHLNTLIHTLYHQTSHSPSSRPYLAMNGDFIHTHIQGSENLIKCTQTYIWLFMFSGWIQIDFLWVQILQILVIWTYRYCNFVGVSLVASSVSGLVLSHKTNICKN